MQYIELKKQLNDFIVFSLRDIKKVDASFHRQRLNEWQTKGYIKKVINEYYIFSDLEINESVLFIVANNIFDPSYVSLEMALSYYDLIPESVYAVTSVSSRKTYTFSSPLARFSYKKIKSGLMFGYRLEKYRSHSFKIAEIEKAVLDYFYINAGVKTIGDFEGLRINTESFNEQINMKKFKNYLKQFNNKALEKRINNFLEFMSNA